MIKKQTIYAFIVSIAINCLIVINLEYTATSYYKRIDLIPYTDYSFWILFGCLSFVMTKFNSGKSYLPSGIINATILITVVYPSFYYVYLSSYYNENEFLAKLIILLLSCYLFDFISTYRVEKNKISLPQLNKNQFEFLIAISLVGCILILTYYFSGIMSLDWSSMYDRRFQARDIFAANSFLRYGNAIFGGLLIPFGAMYAAMNRRISLFYLSILGGIVCFSAFGGKGVLLIPYVAYGVGYILKDKEFRNNYYFVSFLMLMFFIFSSIDLVFSEVGLLNWYIFRRIFYVPAELTTQYLDYFSKNDLYYMSDSIFSFMTNISNEYTKARLIGGVYYGSYLINANTNMYAAAYGDFGVFGFLIVSCLASILARCLNIIYLNKKAPIVLIYSLFVGLVWSQGAFHTSLLSNGVLVGIILFAFIPKSQVK